jgi:hypothetical protein
MRNRMRGILVLVIALSVLSGVSFAQKNRGLRGGWMESEITKGNEGWFNKNYRSFYVGFFNDQKLIPMLYIYTALDYYQTGSRYDDNNKLILHYISIPIGLKLKVGPVQAFGGVHGAVRVSSKLTVLGESVKTEGFSTFDSGAFVGAGLHIAFIGVEGKYTWGLSSVKNGYKNNFWQIGLTLGF